MANLVLKPKYCNAKWFERYYLPFIYTVFREIIIELLLLHQMEK